LICCGVDKEDGSVRVGSAEGCDRLLFSNRARALSTVQPTESLKTVEVFIALGLGPLFLA